MKIALCFSGFIRDLNETKEFWTSLIKQYDIDVYASFWDEENTELDDTINNFLKIYTPKKYETESYKVFKESTQDIASLYIDAPMILQQRFRDSSKTFGQLSMYYKVWKCNMLSKQIGIEYDVIIRARTDIVLDETLAIEKNNMLNVPVGHMGVTSFSNSEGMNDCFAFGPPKIMDYYSFIFLKMMNYLKDGHYAFPPEHFLTVHFNQVKIKVRYFPTYMIITRVSKGTPHDHYNSYVKDPIEEILDSDRNDALPDPQYTFYKPIKDNFIV